MCSNGKQCVRHDCTEEGDVELLVDLEGRREGANNETEVGQGSSSCR